MSLIKIGLLICLLIEVFLFCSVWYKLRRGQARIEGQARISGLKLMLAFSASAALGTLHDLSLGVLRHDQVYMVFGWLPLLLFSLWGYISLSREDKKFLDMQNKQMVEEEKAEENRRY